VPLKRAPILFLCFALLLQAAGLWGKDRWNELNIGPFFVDSETDSAAARDALTQLEQLRWVLGGLLESKDLNSVWPIRVILSESAKTNPTTAGTEFVLQNGQYLLLTAPGSHLPLGQVAAILMDANTPRMPGEVESGLQQLFDTLEAHGSRVSWGGPPVIANLAYARMQLLATKFEYGASLHIFINALKGGSTLRAAEKNAFNQDPATIEKEAAERLARADWQSVSVSGRALDPKRDFGQHSLDPVIAQVYLADSQLNADPKAAEAAYKAAVDAGGVAAALGYEGLAQIARLKHADPAPFLQSAMKVGSKSAPVYVAAAALLGDMATDDQALPLLKKAAQLNPMWAEPVFRQAEFIYDKAEKESIIKTATQLDPRLSNYWIELAKLQIANGHVQAAQGSWLRAEDSAPNEAERERIHNLYEASENERLNAADAERRREREAPHLADQRAQQAEMDRIHAAEVKANQALDAASGMAAPVDAVPWSSVVPKKKITGVLTQVDCLHAGVRLLVKSNTGQVLPLYLKDAAPLNLTCGVQRNGKRVSIAYSAEPDENRHTQGNVTSIQWR
jgi:CheY-like chemotaxis protein